uniref:Uncharacterized protein n=1 Tax=Arundo donax TaxID=35708 RepID=A0A0A9FYT2_ARUDO
MLDNRRINKYIQLREEKHILSYNKIHTLSISWGKNARATPTTYYISNIYTNC